MGILKEERFYDIEEMITYGQFLYLYYSWKHMVKEISKGLPSVMKEKHVFNNILSTRDFRIKLGCEADREMGKEKGL